MSNPIVESFVEDWENGLRHLGSHLTHDQTDALIADWRKRGEALKWIADDRYRNRDTVSPANAWAMWQKHSKQYLDILDRADCALK